MVEQFREVTKKAIGGRAKAMIVTPITFTCCSIYERI